MRLTTYFFFCLMQGKKKSDISIFTKSSHYLLSAYKVIFLIDIKNDLKIYVDFRIVNLDELMYSTRENRLGS